MLVSQPKKAKVYRKNNLFEIKFVCFFFRKKKKVLLKRNYTCLYAPKWPPAATKLKKSQGGWTRTNCLSCLHISCKAINLRSQPPYLWLHRTGAAVLNLTSVCPHITKTDSFQSRIQMPPRPNIRFVEKLNFGHICKEWEMCFIFAL